jgi:hypothetical protein
LDPIFLKYNNPLYIAKWLADLMHHILQGKGRIIGDMKEKLKYSIQALHQSSTKLDEKNTLYITIKFKIQDLQFDQ